MNSLLITLRLYTLNGQTGFTSHGLELVPYTCLVFKWIKRLETFNHAFRDKKCSCIDWKWIQTFKWQTKLFFYTFCLVSWQCLKRAFKVGRSCSSSVSYFASRDVHLSDISNEKVFKQQEKNTVNVGVSTWCFWIPNKEILIVSTFSHMLMSSPSSTMNFYTLI